MKKHILLLLPIFLFACGGHNKEYNKEIFALKDSVVSVNYFGYNLTGSFDSAIALTRKLNQIKKIRNAIINDTIIEFENDLLLSVNESKPACVKCKILPYNNKIDSIILDFDVLASSDSIFKLYQLKYGNGYTEEEIKMTPIYWSEDFYELEKQLTLHKWTFKNTRIELYRILKKVKSTTRILDESRTSLRLRNPMNYFKEVTRESTIETLTVKYVNTELESMHNQELKHQNLLKQEQQNIKVQKDSTLHLKKKKNDSIINEKRRIEIQNQKI
jgi:hypothetical protein